MNNPPADNSAVAVISERLTSIGVFNQPPLTKLPHELWGHAAATLASAAANTVAQLAEQKKAKHLDRPGIQRAALAALEFAAVADLCIARAAEIAALKQKSEDGK